MIAHTFSVNGPFDSELSAYRLDVDGSTSSQRLLWDSAYRVSGRYIHLDEVTGYAHILGEIQTSDGLMGFHHTTLDDALNSIDSVVYICPEQATLFMDNACVSSSGRMLILGYGRTDPPGAVNTFLITTNMDGDSLDAYQSSYGTFHVPRSGVFTSNDTALIAFRGAMPQLPFGTASYVRLDENLDYVDGFNDVPYDGSPGPLTLSNSVNDGQYMSILPNGNLLVSGRAGNLSDGYSTVLQVLTPQGEWVGSFAPERELGHVHPALYGGHVLTSENEILFVVTDNFFTGPPSLWEPTEPSKVTVYRLDTDLNVLCSAVVDGFVDNTYYFVTRVKESRTGEIVLTGTRKDLSNGSSSFEGWVQQIARNDCGVTVDERLGANQVHAYPNPGLDAFTVQVNGAIDPRAIMRLFTSDGRMVQELVVLNGSANIDASHWGSGLYHFRITDRTGRPIASGHWVRE